MPCADQVSAAKLATELDTATTATATATAPTAAAADDDDDDDDAGSCKASDSWKIDSLSPPQALLQPVKYPPMHIFVSCY